MRLVSAICWSDALRSLKANETTILLGYFKAHLGKGAKLWKGVIGQHVDTDVNDNGRFCCNCAVTTHSASWTLSTQS